jgi:hypothetical protein
MRLVLEAAADYYDYHQYIFPISFHIFHIAYHIFHITCHISHITYHMYMYTQYVYIHIYIHTYIHIHTYIYVYIYMYPPALFLEPGPRRRAEQLLLVLLLRKQALLVHSLDTHLSLPILVEEKKIPKVSSTVQRLNMRALTVETERY